MLMNEVMFQPDRWKSVAVCICWTKWMHDDGDNNLLSLSLSLSLFACISSETTESFSVEFSISGLHYDWCDGHPFVS
jgi:hypothetical protein